MNYALCFPCKFYLNYKAFTYLMVLFWYELFFLIPPSSSMPPPFSKGGFLPFLLKERKGKGSAFCVPLIFLRCANSADLFVLLQARCGCVLNTYAAQSESKQNNLICNSIQIRQKIAGFCCSHLTIRFFWLTFSFRKEKVSGFGLLPDIVPAWAQGRCETGAAKWRWTSTRYACPRRERRESRKK